MIAAIAVSCNKNETLNEPVRGIVFTASLEQTKVAVDVEGRTGKVNWEAGDVVTVYNTKGESESVTLTAADIDGTSATIATKTITEDTGYIAYCGGNVKSVTTADCAAGTLAFKNNGNVSGANSMLMVAKAEGTDFSFKNVFDLIAFSTNATDASYAVLSAESNFAYADGTDVTVDCTAGILSTSAAAKTLTVTMGEGTNFFPVVPGSVLNGFSIKVYNAGGTEVASVTTDKTLDLSARNKLVNVGVVKKPSLGPAATFTTSNSVIECAFGYGKTVEFTAAAAWTASVKEEGCGTVQTASGAAGAASTVLDFTANTTTSRRSVTLVISADGYDDAELVFTQERKADYEMVFRKYPDAYSKDTKYRNWSNTFTKSFSSNAPGTFTLKSVNSSVSSSNATVAFSFKEGAKAGSFAYNETGFMVGNADSKNGTLGGTITFNVPNTTKKLVKVEVFTSATTSNQQAKITILAEDGTTVSGGSEIRPAINTVSSGHGAIDSIHYELTNAYSSYACWTLTNTVAGEAYTMDLSTRLMVRWITFYYE